MVEEEVSSCNKVWMGKAGINPNLRKLVQANPALEVRCMFLYRHRKILINSPQYRVPKVTGG
jgi:hypothetical protein